MAKNHDWKVYYSGGFYDHNKWERAGKEIYVGKQFVWDEEIWHIPAVYSCAAGLVVDFCIRIEPEQVRSFAEKWDLLLDPSGDHLTDEQRERADFENPLRNDFSCDILLNGKILQMNRGTGKGYIPGMTEVTNDPDAEKILEHYGLDPEKAWSIHRVCFPWATKSKPQIKSLRLTLKQDPVPLSSARFKTPKIGEKITFIHPISGAEYALTAEDVSYEELNFSFDENKELDCPTHYTQISYRLSPNLSNVDFQLRDCKKGDIPRIKAENLGAIGSVDSSSSIGIIGGADGPTTVFLIPNSPREDIKIACSSLYFEPKFDTEWRGIFNVVTREDISVEVL